MVIFVHLYSPSFLSVSSNRRPSLRNNSSKKSGNCVPEDSGCRISCKSGTGALDSEQRLDSRADNQDASELSRLLRFEMEKSADSGIGSNEGGGISVPSQVKVGIPGRSTRSLRLRISEEPKGSVFSHELANRSSEADGEGVPMDSSDTVRSEDVGLGTAESLAMPGGVEQLPS